MRQKRQPPAATPADSSSSGAIVPAAPSAQTPAPNFTKVDNNLTSVGFFTASSKRSRLEREKDLIIVEQGVTRRITILPSAKYGMPITQDQDYWLALMKLVSEHAQQVGKLKNPFKFTTAELLRILGLVHGGRAYEDVIEWADIMAFTGIKGGVYDAAKKRWLIDRTHAVERFLTAGKQLPDGSIAEKNYVWFSEWQLDNINSGKLIPVELTTYIQLKTNIARNLVPHLQEWLFASQREGRFEKSYADLCQLLGICAYRHLSQIERKLAPSLNELVTHGYIAKWIIEPMAGSKTYKLVLWHGAKYHTDRKSRIDGKRAAELPEGEAPPTGRRPRQQRLQLSASETLEDGGSPATSEKPPQPPVDEKLVAELLKRGIAEGDARKLLAKLAPDQPVMDQLEYADAVISQSRGKIQNPRGFYISRLQDNSPNPPWFESAAAKKIREEAEDALAAAIAEERLARIHTEETERSRVDAEIDALPEPQRQALFDQAKAQLLASYPGMAQFFKAHPEEALRDGAVRGKMRRIFTQN